MLSSLQRGDASFPGFAVRGQAHLFVFRHASLVARIPPVELCKPQSGLALRNAVSSSDPSRTRLKRHLGECRWMDLKKRNSGILVQVTPADFGAGDTSESREEAA